MPFAYLARAPWYFGALFIFFRPFPCHPPYTSEVGGSIRQLKILAKFALATATAGSSVCDHFEGAPANPHPQSPRAAGTERVAGEVEPRPPRGGAS